MNRLANSTPEDQQQQQQQQRVRCYRCYRPQDACFCDRIPVIDNATHVLILQHMRERTHPFNTARICKQALQNSTLLVDHNLQLATRLDEFPLQPGAGLLYPGEGGKLLSDLSPAERPKQLVVIDGTWHHAKTLVRDIPLLGELPRYQILPTKPGRYRIRKEPTETSLSTLEAIVAALDAVEPETAGLTDLVAAFNWMVESQLAHPKADYGWRENKRRSHNAMGIPRAILHDLPNIVVAYGESEPGKTGCKRSPKSSDQRRPVYWVAERLVSGESFRCLIQSPVEFPEHFQEHIGLSASQWSDAVSAETFCQKWKEFLRPDDHVVVYHGSTARLLDNVGAVGPRKLVLKSVNFDPEHQHPTLDSYLRANQIEVPASQHPGRAGQRLANGIAMIHHLNQFRESMG